MKVKKQLVILIIMLLALMLLPTISRAGIESKPGATAVWTNISISDAYKVCYDLRYTTSTLGTNSLDPHLSLNKDWGAVAYLGLSSYGSVRSSNGVSVSINGKSYYSTTKNITGVINFGKTKTRTSCIIKDTREDNPKYRENLINALKDSTNSKYVENLEQDFTTNILNSKGMAVYETEGWYNMGSGVNLTAPCFARYGLCGTTNSYGTSSFNGWGGEANDVTFRPAIWN